MSHAALPGFREFYPAEFAVRNHIIGAWRRVAQRYAFQEYDGPPLEPLELYTRKSGAEIVEQLYNFVDKGGREVALRPEMTPTFARMVAARAQALRKPVRWFSVPQLFRYERQQRGRLREHFQLNVDIVGEADVTADAELLAVCIDVTRELGLGSRHVVARVSDRKLLNSILDTLGILQESRPAAYAAIDKLEREERRSLSDKLLGGGLDAGQIDRLFRVVDAGAGGLDNLLDESLGLAGNNAFLERVDAFRRYLSYVDALGFRDWVRFDLSIVRGLAYYTGIVFELFDRAGALRAICGGGRYDGLLAALGGSDMPALGFGMGDVVLAELLREHELLPTSAAQLDYWVAGDASVSVEDVMRLASRLRSSGASVEYALRTQSLSRQLKAAGSIGARRAVILGGPLEGDSSVRIRDLADGAEAEVPVRDLPGAP